MSSSGFFRLWLRGHLWRYDQEGRKVLEIPADGRTTVGEILSHMGIGRDEIMMVLSKGKRVDLFHVPQPEEELELLPVIDGG